MSLVFVNILSVIHSAALSLSFSASSLPYHILHSIFASPPMPHPRLGHCQSLTSKSWLQLSPFFDHCITPYFSSHCCYYGYSFFIFFKLNWLYPFFTDPHSLLVFIFTHKQINFTEITFTKIIPFLTVRSSYGRWSKGNFGFVLSLSDFSFVLNANASQLHGFSFYF